jgi:hypothetical protein
VRAKMLQGTLFPFHPLLSCMLNMWLRLGGGLRGRTENCSFNPTYSWGSECIVIPPRLHTSLCDCVYLGKGKNFLLALHKTYEHTYQLLCNFK